LVRAPPSAFGFKHVFVVPALYLSLGIEGYLILVYALGFTDFIFRYFRKSFRVQIAPLTLKLISGIYRREGSQIDLVILSDRGSWHIGLT